jgi:hypothetical protein
VSSHPCTAIQTVSPEVPKPFLCIQCFFHECDNAPCSSCPEFNCHTNIIRTVLLMKKWGESGRPIWRLPEPSWLQWDSKPRIASSNLSVSQYEGAREVKVMSILLSVDFRKRSAAENICFNRDNSRDFIILISIKCLQTDFAFRYTGSGCNRAEATSLHHHSLSPTKFVQGWRICG